MKKINLEIKIDKEEFRKKLNLKDGEPGSDYILTKRDKKEIASKIEVPVVEKEIREINIADTPEQLRDKLENLKKGKKLSIQAIEGLAKILEELSKKPKEQPLGLLKGSIHAGKGREIRFVDDETPTNSGDDTIFTLSKNPLPGSLKLYRNGARQRVTEDYTLSGKTITLIIPLQSVDEVLLADYRY